MSIISTPHAAYLFVDFLRNKVNNTKKESKPQHKEKLRSASSELPKT